MYINVCITVIDYCSLNIFFWLLYRNFIYKITDLKYFTVLKDILVRLLGLLGELSSV